MITAVLQISPSKDFNHKLFKITHLPFLPQTGMEFHLTLLDEKMARFKVTKNRWVESDRVVIVFLDLVEFSFVPQENDFFMEQWKKGTYDEFG